MPAYTFRSVGTSASGTGSITAGMPAGWAAGDLLLIHASARSNAESFATPSGWTALSPNSVTPYEQLFGRIAVGGDTAPAMDAVTGTGRSRVQMCAFNGDVYANLASIVHASVDTLSPASDVSIDYAALTLSLDNCLCIALAVKNKTSASDGSSVNTLSGFTTINSEVDSGTGITTYWGYQQQTSHTNLTAATQTLNSSSETLQHGAVYVALKTAITGSGTPHQGSGTIDANGSSGTAGGIIAARALILNAMHSN